MIYYDILLILLMGIGNVTCVTSAGAVVNVTAINWATMTCLMLELC